MYSIYNSSNCTYAKFRPLAAIGKVLMAAESYVLVPSICVCFGIARHE